MRQSNRQARAAARVIAEILESRSLFTTAAWSALASVPTARGLSTDMRLESFRPFTLATGSMANSLSKAPDEDVAAFGVGLGSGSRLIAVPRPDGTLAKFRVVESSIMAPELAAAFESIKTYAGVGVDDPSARIRLDLTPLGFHAQVLTEAKGGAYYVEPYYHLNQSVYASYFGSAAGAHDGISAQLNDTVGDTAAAAVGKAARSSGTTLRTYRAAVACTGEYAGYFGGTKTNALSAIVTAMNRVTGIYESELSIRMTLVAGQSKIVYTNPDADPYTNDDGYALLDENQANIDSVIGDANYDIGHVFSTDGGGVAYLGSVGESGIKAGGETGQPNPVGDAFTVDYVAHEMGHQFGGDHTFNTSTDGNREATAAYEPGSGSTIMAYAGITGENSDLQPHSDPYFAWHSLDQIVAYVDDAIPNVGTRTATGNRVPTVSAGPAYTIPAATPFALTATGTDPDGNPLSYSWEQADLGPATTLADADNGTSPLFRVYNPSTSPTRSFPRLESVLSGANATASPSGGLSERLPTTNRTMKFVVTARDRQTQNGAGAFVNSAPVSIKTSVFKLNGVVTGFGLTNFNSSTTVAGGSSQTLTWQVANTTSSPINTANVKILMSLDGGRTFPIVLAASTPNDGSQDVAMPYDTASSQVRFQVQAVGNVFYDINNANLTLTKVAGPGGGGGSLAGVTFDDTNKNGTLDAGEPKTSGKTVFIDADNDNVLDSTEKKTTTASDGSWKFTGLTAGTYRVRRVFPNGYTLSTSLINQTLAAGQTVTGLLIGSKSGTVAATGSIAGFAFNDLNKNASYNTGDTLAGGKTIYLDLDDDGIKDAGEASVTTAADGTFKFSGLAARTYHVRRVFSPGYAESTPARYVTLASGQNATGVSIGSKVK